jgi:hypothetical protein
LVQVDFHFADRVGLRGIGNGVGEDFVNAVDVAQEQAFRAVEFVIFDVIAEGAELLEHFADDGFGANVFLADPGMAVSEKIEGGVNEFAARLWV